LVIAKRGIAKHFRGDVNGAKEDITSATNAGLKYEFFSFLAIFSRGSYNPLMSAILSQ
jgi:hypothetical protein